MLSWATRGCPGRRGLLSASGTERAGGSLEGSVLRRHPRFGPQLPNLRASPVSREEEAGEEQPLEEGRTDGCGKLVALLHINFTPFAFNEVRLSHAHFVINFDSSEMCWLTFSQGRTVLRAAGICH